MTKLELTQINTRLATENASLRTELAAARLDLQVLAKRTKDLASAPRPDVSVRHEAMMAARALALSTGRCIKV